MALPARLRKQPAEQNAADALAPYAFLDTEGDLRQAILGLLRPMQLGRAAYDAVFHVGHDDRAVVGTLLGIALDEAFIDDAVEAVATAVRIEAQQVIAQERQLFLLAQGPNVAKARPRAMEGVVWHVKSPRHESLEEASNP